MSEVKETWMLEREVILTLCDDTKMNTLFSKQYFSSHSVAEATKCSEHKKVIEAIKACYGVPASSDDIITIGNIIVNRRDIAAVNFTVSHGHIVEDKPEEPDHDQSCDEAEDHDAADVPESTDEDVGSGDDNEYDEQ